MGPQTKRAKKRCWPCRSFFLHEYLIFKIRIFCSRTRSEDQILHAKVQSVLVPLTFG